MCVRSWVLKPVKIYVTYFKAGPIPVFDNLHSIQIDREIMALNFTARFIIQSLSKMDIYVLAYIRTNTTLIRN